MTRPRHPLRYGPVRPRPRGRTSSSGLAASLRRDVQVASRLLDYDPVLVIRFITGLLSECHWGSLAAASHAALQDYLAAHPDPDPPQLNPRQRGLLQQLARRLDYDGYPAAQFAAALADDIKLPALAHQLSTAASIGLADD